MKATKDRWESDMDVCCLTGQKPGLKNFCLFFTYHWPYPLVALAALGFGTWTLIRLIWF